MANPRMARTRPREPFSTFLEDGLAVLRAVDSDRPGFVTDGDECSAADHCDRSIDGRTGLEDQR